MVFQVNEKFVTDENMTITSTGVLSDAFHRYYHNYYMSSRTIINRLKELHTAAYENYTHNTDHRIQELNLVDCIADYGSSFQSQRGNLLLVTANDTLSTAEGLLTTFYNGPKNLHQAFEWMCPWNPINETWSQICDDNLPRIKQNPNSWRPFGSEIQKCYSQKTDEHCKLLYSSTLCWIVMALNLLKSVLMLFFAFSSSERPILTIGDAITSFIGEKDQTTVGMCLKSKHSFRKNDWGATPRHFSSKRHRKFAASSLRYWAICVILYICALTGCLYLLVFGMNFMEGEKDIVGLGFGALHSKTILNIGLLGQGSKFLVLNAMLANTPQVIMSLLYFNYNALYTGISLITEWDRFGSHRKGLRVSTKPQAAQRETYFLQLPYRYSLPLVVFSGVMHWLISQSIFLVNLEVYGPSETDVMNFISPSVVDLETPDNNGYPEYNFTTCGWSPLGVILVVVLAFCMLCFLVFSGSQRLKFGRLPLAGSCSAAISAACHSTAGDPKAWERELQWGVVVAATDDPGRCAFTSLAAEKPQEGKLYA